MTLPLNPPTAANPATAMGVVFFFFRTSQEPEYQGRSLSSWLTQLDNWDGLDTNAPVVFAVRAIGSNEVSPYRPDVLRDGFKLKAERGRSV